MKIGLYTLGCKVNQYETQAMESELLARGHELVKFHDIADAYVVNTCTVTAVSDKKSRQAIRQAKARNPGAIIAVCGCYAQTSPEDVKKLDVDLICGTGNRGDFVQLLEQACKSKSVINLDDVMSRRVFEPLPAGGLSNRTRAMLKVQDGCANFCAYCIIPYARGPVRSLPLDLAADQAQKLYEYGYRELVVTGIEISSYGLDLKDGSNLKTLVSALCSHIPQMRIRLGSMEPRTIDEDFCRTLSGFENLCPQFHLSLQSGCDATLLRMRRKYDTARFYESVSLLRRYFPECAVTTDLIVGFPGETDEEFENTIAFIQKCGFASMHIFPYSQRAGTPAAIMDHQVPGPVKEERAAGASQIAALMKQAYLKSCVGKIFPVLFEQGERGQSQGHAPNYMLLKVASDIEPGQVLPVLAVKAENGSLFGEVAL